jgi:DNA repair photolyase
VTDTYTAREAARVIGRSERLVRRLAETGRLEVVSTEPLRVSQESVHRERSSRRARPDKKPEPAAGITPEQLEQIVSRAVAAAISEVVPRMLETRDDIERRMAAELAAARQEVEQLRQELSQSKNDHGLRLPPIGWPFRR